ncbi:uncharacterized protein LOC131144004 [Malania oleifera]|uniref:uncharacterized protein LOC131144004 n=1 Tax=Malania oleifera TaxID=397392 RepID=UPI0025AE91EA|nr:uncharacterized protein LOC131144004 [Malania oleifera]
MNAQVIHCHVVCSITANSFALSFVYGFNTIVLRRPLWENLIQYSLQTNSPWLAMGDFNCVLKADAKQNGVPVTNYDIKDINECFCDAGLSDLNSSSCYLTWTNGNAWCKLDRVVVNLNWINAGFVVHTKFHFPGLLSDHSSCNVSLFKEENYGKRPFKFFNMWVNHSKFQEVVRKGWDLDVQGHIPFRIVKKLQALKQPLRDLNALHFSHITARADKVVEEVMEIQKLLHNATVYVELQRKLILKKDEANKIVEENKLFLAQLAKAKYLRDSDKSTSFFHALMRRKVNRNHITVVKKSNGDRTVSQQQMVGQFLDFYKKLLGEEMITESVDPQVVAKEN